MRQEPRHEDNFLVGVIEHDNPPDDAALGELDHPHTGLPRRYSLHQAATLTSGRSATRRVEITENSATMASTLNSNRPTASLGHTQNCRGSAGPAGRSAHRRSPAHQAANGPAGPVLSPPRCLPPGRPPSLPAVRAVPIGAGQPVVDVDAGWGDTQSSQSVALGGEVLLIGGPAGVPDEKRRHEHLQ